MENQNIYLPSFTPNFSFEKKLRELLEAKNMKIPSKLDYQSFFDSDDFFNDLNEQFEYLSNNENSNLFCYSMGANLGLILTNKYPNIKNLILMSIPIKPFHLTQNINDLYSTIVKKEEFDIDEYSNHYASDKINLIKRNVDLHRLMLFRKSIILAKEQLDFIYTPTLIVAGEKDAFVSPSGSEYVYNHLQGKATLISVENGRHPVLLSTKRQIIIDEVEQFLYEDCMTKKRKII